MVIIPQDLKPNEVCIMHSTQVVFFSQFCDLVPLPIITRGINQIWLYMSQYVFAACWNILCQNGDIGKKNSSKSGNFGTFFFDKTPLYVSR